MENRIENNRTQSKTMENRIENNRTQSKTMENRIENNRTQLKKVENIAAQHRSIAHAHIRLCAVSNSDRRLRPPSQHTKMKEITFLTIPSLYLHQPQHIP